MSTTTIHFELREYIDDLPWPKTYHRESDAITAARRKAEKLGVPIQVWRLTHLGESFVGEF